MSGTLVPASPAIEIPVSGGRKLAVYQSQPTSGSGPAIVLVQDTFKPSGGDLRQVADLFAEEGYVAMAADLSMAAADETDLKRALDDLNSLLHARPVGAAKVGVIGFGRGGLIAYLAATRLPIDAAVAFDTPGLEPSTDTDPELRCPMVVHFGVQDDPASAQAVKKLRAALTKIGDVTVFAYADASAGFYVPGHASFQHLASQLAHARTIALLRRTLGPHYNLEAVWDAHLEWEFSKVDAEGTLTTMIAEPVNLNVPVLTGGIGREGVLRYYQTQFLGQMPKDAHLVQISRTIGADRVVDEHLLCFTHDRAMDAMLPGIAPTGKYVELPVVVIVSFRGDKVSGEHIYWDQASLLVQVGKLPKKGLPVAGIESAQRLRDEGLPVEALKKRWEK